jgi:transcriptional regulator with XRE-family HTH domain
MARLRIKEEAKAAGITLEELAERVGIDQGHFTRQVSGKRPIKFGQMEAVARELQRPVTALIEEKDENSASGLSGNSSEVDAFCAVLKAQPPALQKRALRVILALIEDEKENQRGGKNGTERPEE